MLDASTSRRRFLAYFSGLGLGSTLFPEALWARVQEQQVEEVTPEMVKTVAALSDLELTDEQAEEMAGGATRNLRGYARLREEFELDNHIAPPLHFSPLVPGMEVDRVERPFRPSSATGIHRPSDLEEVAFWPLTALGELIRTRQVTSVELTRMYLARLKRYNPKLNFVVNLTEELALQEARRADEEIGAGRYRGPLHGIPWGAKDILAVKGYPTTWGSPPFENRVTDYEATVVKLLRDAGAVLVAKLATGELASGDQWFGGRTRNPWDATKGSSGSSAGPASAVAAGCVGFALGTETSGSILSPSTACGATGLRPTFGRVSGYGVMVLRWTGDRVGPICRTAEDCALVFQAVARPDEHDPGVVDLPFNWDAGADATRLRVAYLQDAFEDDPGKGDDWKANDRRTLDTLRSMGFDMTPVQTPLMDFPTDALRGLGAESTAAFEGFLREGKDAQMDRPGRGGGWRSGFLIPAVQYLQAQRVRGIMIKRLHDALPEFDVLVAPQGDMRWYLADEDTRQRPERPERDRPVPASHFFQLANHACWPAVAVRNGLGRDGLPTAVAFVGRPYHESKILTVARAYQEKAGFHRERPPVGG